MSLHHQSADLEEILRRSDALEAAVVELLGPDSYQTYDESRRVLASFAACSVSLEHAQGLRLLVREGLPTSGISLMRLQHEALTRSVWLLYAASDEAIERLLAPLTSAAEKVANKLPMLTEMLGAIAGKAPHGATQMLSQFKEVHAPALNSFVHGGIHPLQRHADGYPLPLLIQIIQSSNGLLTMSGMMLAILSGNPSTAKRMRGIQQAFADCLPELLTTPPA